MLFESVHRNCSWKKLWIQLWSLWQKFHQSFHESDKTLDWNYKLQLFMKMKRFNFDQCGKNSARGCNLNDHEIGSWIEFWTSLFWELKLKKDTYKFFFLYFNAVVCNFVAFAVTMLCNKHKKIKYAQNAIKMPQFGSIFIKNFIFHYHFVHNDLFFPEIHFLIYNISTIFPLQYIMIHFTQILKFFCADFWEFM